MVRRPLIRIIGPLLVLASVCSASVFDGRWRGTYNGQPTTLLPDGSYPETVTPFELRLQEKNGGITGEFRGGAHDAAAEAYPLKNGKIFGNRACFDIVIGSEDMRWCVLVRGNRLRGTWSEGPEGGPLLGGAGAGARLFGITGSKTE